MQLEFFCLLLVMSSVNFDVCLIAFVMYLLNGVPFSSFVSIVCLFIWLFIYVKLKNGS